MNKANECTCPSGDGSLVHPCPAHPAVEQAGANVGHGHVFPRADGVKMRCGGPGLCSECTADASRARAALAQPSQSQYEASFEEWLANELEGEDGQPVPAAVCDITLARRAFNHWPKLEQPAKVGSVRFSAGVSSRLVVEAAQRLCEFESTPEKEAERIERLQAFREQLDPLNLTPHAEAFNEAPAEALRPEQAEAKRPAVVGYRSMESGMVYEQDYGLKDPEALTTVAECDSIVGELRAENAKLSDDLNRLSIIRARLNLRLDFALDKISKLESRWPHGESPEERFEHYISNTIDRAPGPLRRLGNWLSHVLDEDQWTTAERMLTGACVAAEERAAAQTQHSVPEGWMLVECGIWTQEQVDEMQKTVARFRNSEFVDNRALAMAVADAGQCKAPEISLAELLAAAPGNSAQHSVPEGLALIPVRETEAMHDAVMALLYKGVARTDTQKLLDAYIAAAPQPAGGE
ncbi:hypothetical protein RIM32_001009 [Pseudomonas aeruginosa]|nr:hypothetical protein [Pseudomonas aeruginosa]